MSISTIVPSIDTNLQYKDIKLQSGSATSFRTWVSSSFSNQTCTFSCPPPSTNVFIDRCIMMRQPVHITFTGTNSGAAIMQLGHYALRGYPLGSIITNCQLTLNNQQFSIQANQFVPYMARFWKKHKLSSFPDYLDEYSNYSDGVTSINNSLGSYFNANSKDSPRGAFPMIVVNSNSAASIDATIYEPLWIPCLRREFDSTLGFTNIKSMDVIVNYSTNIQRIMSQSIDSTTFSNTVVTLGQPSLLMKYTSPPTSYVPKSLKYESEVLNRYITPLPSTFLAGTSNTITSTNMQLGYVPKYVLIYVRPSDSDLTQFSPDVACNISNISCNFNNVSGILSSCTELDLYKMSASNGLKSSWTQYHGVTSILDNQIGTTGSFLKLMFGKDIMLQENVHPNQAGPFNFSFTLTYTNTTGNTINNPILTCITSTTQVLHIHENADIEVTQGIKFDESSESTYVPWNELSQNYGGSFWDTLKSILRGVHSFVKQNRLISTGLDMLPIPEAKIAAQAARAMGYGMDSMDGGRITSRKEMLRKIKSM